MTRYQLLKLVSWAGTLHSRKRLQKVAFLLQAAGCPLEAEFYLDVVGPYSEDVRHRLDELVVLSLLEEQASGPQFREQFSYRLTATAKDNLVQLEQSEKGRPLFEQMAPFESLAQKLLPAEPAELEIAATIVYFRKLGMGWSEAIEQTCDYKRLAAESTPVRRAVELAQHVEKERKSAA